MHKRVQLILSFYGCIVALVFMLSCVSKSNAKNLAKAKFDLNTVTITRVPIGDSVTIIYHVKNIGEEDLRIINVSPDCQCSIAYFDSIAIKPQRYGEIKVTYVNMGDTVSNIKKVFVAEMNTRERLYPLYLIIK